MMLRQKLNYIVLMLALGLVPCAIGAQTKPDSTDTNAVETNHERSSYLDRFEAIKRARRLQGRTIVDIQRLKIIVSNFGGKVPDATNSFDSIKKTYRDAQVKWYRRRYVESRKLHETSHGHVQSLYKQFVVVYNEQVAQLLTDCSELIVNVEFSQSVEPGKEINLNKLIQESSSKLQIAYHQMAEAENMIRQERYSDAIDHYRLAKLFAISVLKKLESDESKRKEVDQKYQVDQLDAKGYTNKSDR